MILDILSSFKFIEKYLPVADYIFTNNFEEAKKFLEEKRKIVLKAVSPEIVHKTEWKAVYVGIDSEEKLKEAWDNLMKLKEKVNLKGILVQEFVPGLELFFSVVNDKNFGKVILFGLGGIFVEVFKDTVFLPIDATRDEIEKAIERLKSSKILKGYRTNVNYEKLIEFIEKLRNLEKENFKIVEMNPVMFNEKGCFVVDARVEV